MKVSVEEARLKMMTCHHRGEDRLAVAEDVVVQGIGIRMITIVTVWRMRGIDVEIESEREKDGNVIETEKGIVTDIAIEIVIAIEIGIGIATGIVKETAIGIVTEIVKEIVTGIANEIVIGIVIMVGSMKEIAIGIVTEEVEEITTVIGTDEESERRWFIKDGTDSTRLFTNC